MATENKIKFGIKNAAFAIATIGSDGSATYGEVKQLPGIRSVSFDAQGDTTKVYADNMVWVTLASNTGYEGDAEFVVIPEIFRTTVMGESADANGVLVEDADAQPKHFAFLWQFEGDASATRHVLYNCTATRASLASNTKEEAIDPQFESVTISATPIYVPAIEKNITKSRTNQDTDATVYENWFESVYVPGAAEPEEEPASGGGGTGGTGGSDNTGGGGEG